MIDIKYDTKYKYTHGPALSEVDLRYLYQSMVDAGLAKFIFYAKDVCNHYDWSNSIHANSWWVARVERPDGSTVGAWWLNNFAGCTAMAHFCVFDLEDKVDMIKQAMKWLSDKDILDSLYGVTPKPYRNVWPAIEAAGFERSGVLYGACHMAYYNKYVDGVVSTLNLIKYKE